LNSGQFPLDIQFEPEINPIAEVAVLYLLLPLFFLLGTKVRIKNEKKSANAIFTYFMREAKPFLTKWQVKAAFINPS
jgi:1-acyl-sn-glycerol-3-phosphate acyltransferase